MITRRNLCVGLPLGLGLAPISHALGTPKVIGVFNPSFSEEVAPRLELFYQAMRDLGYVKGVHFEIVARMAEGRNERLLVLAEELVKLKVDLIFAASTHAVAAVQESTTTIPIVFIDVADPVRAGFADSLARPGRNMTGLSNFSADLNPKRFDLLKQMVPGLSRVVLLVNRNNPYYPSYVQRMQHAAEQLGLQTMPANVSASEDLELAFRAMKEFHAGAFLVTTDAYLWELRQRIADLALRNRLPSMSGFEECAEVGGLLSYGADSKVPMRRAATYVDKIFRGAKPSDLPIEQPTKVDLVINRKTASALQLTIPPVLLLQAERVIE